MEKKAGLEVGASFAFVSKAGGVAKDYLALCRALIDGLDWQVTLLSPVSIGESGEADVEPPGLCKNLMAHESMLFMMSVRCLT